MSKLDTYEQEIYRHIDEMIRLASDLSESVIRWKPSDSEWSVMETLCHVEEANVYWTNELLRVVKQPDTQWGRGMDHEGRLKAIANADERKPQDVIDGVNATRNNIRDTFKALKDDDLNIEAPHRNPKFGTRPMRFLVEHFLVEHLETHVNQIKRVLRQYESQGSNA